MLQLHTSRLRRSILVYLCATLVVGVFFSAAAAAAEERVHPTQLPQDYDYQVVLRDYLATLQESDFEVDLLPVEVDPETVTDLEELHKLWLLFGNWRGHGVSETKGLTLAADNFLLANIETDEGVMIRAGYSGFSPGFYIQPADTAWWARWDHPGNPYRGSREVLNRAFVVAAVDMIMLDHLHESGDHWVNNARRSDFLGGTMIWLTYVYWAIREDLSPEIREAYETGLGKFMDLFTEWGPTGVNDNMDMKANVALATLIETLPDSKIAEQARAYIKRNMNRVHPAGMIRDGGGLDASYNGIALVNIIWAAQIKHLPQLLEVTERMHDLKGHLTLPEPDGKTYFGPSHFSTRTGYGSPNDQWSLTYRDIAAAMLTDDALYLMAGGRKGRGPRSGFPEPDTMRAEVRIGIDYINNTLTASDDRFARWESGWWPGRINYAHDFYRPGFYADMVRLHEAEDPLLYPPFTRSEHRFIRVFPEPGMEGDWIRERDWDSFVSARFDDYGVIAYTGSTGSTRYMNFTGGGLSAFWTPEAGSVILGRTGNPVTKDRTRQTWADWRLWPTHALSGTTADGKAFSSARIRRRVSEVHYDTSEDYAHIHVAGPIGVRHDDGRTVEDGNVLGEVGFSRDMQFDNSGVIVESALYADGRDEITELYEILPLFLDDPQQQDSVPHQVSLFADGEWREATAEPLDGVKAVRVDRAKGGMLIVFEQPRQVRLSPEVWQDNYQSRARLRNLMIDLLRPEDENVHKVRYWIRPLEASGDQGKNAGDLMQKLSDPIPSSLGSDEFVSPQVRRLAVIAAAGQTEADMDVLRRALNDEDNEVRLTAVRSLPATGNDGLLLLRETLKANEDFATRHWAMEVMAEAGQLRYEELIKQIGPAILGDGDDSPSASEAILRWGMLADRLTWDFYQTLFRVDFDEEGYLPIQAELHGDAVLERVGDLGIAMRLPAERGGGDQMNALTLRSPIVGPSPEGAFTLELWIEPQPEALLQNSYLVDKWGAASIGKDYVIMLRSDTKGRLRLRASLGFGRNDNESLQSDWLDIPVDTWSHVALTYDGNGLIRLYLDREPVAEAKFENRGAIVGGGANLTIGDRTVAEHSNFVGKIAGVRIHNSDIMAPGQH